MRLVAGKSVYKLPPNDGVIKVFLRQVRANRRVAEPEHIVRLVRRQDAGPSLAFLHGGYLAIHEGRELQILPRPARNGRLTVIYRPLPRAA